MISTVRVIHRNVKHWSSGEMCLRWTAAGMLEAETRFRRCPATAGSPTSPSRSNATYSVTVKVSPTPRPRRTLQHSLCNHHTRTAATANFHDERGNPRRAVALLCAASGYALWRTVTARFHAPRDETQHINDHLRAAPEVALV